MAPEVDRKKVKSPRKFGKFERLQKRKEFNRLHRRGVKVVGRLFVYLYRPNGLAWSRLGITVSRKVGGAVQRNRVKRLVREAFRHQKETLTVRVDVVVIARRSAAKAVFAEVREELQFFFQQVARKAQKKRAREKKKQ
jgi:ribonuclease P protein component